MLFINTGLHRRRRLPRSDGRLKPRPSSILNAGRTRAMASTAATDGGGGRGEAMAAAAAAAAAPAELTLDRDAFRRRKTVAALRLPAKLCSQAMKALSDQVLRLRGVRAIVKPPGVNEKDEACPERLLLLAGEVKEEEEDTPVVLTDLPPAVQAFVAEQNQQGGNDKSQEQTITVTRHTVLLEYAHMTVDEVLRQLFAPLGLTDPPSAFETSGHVAHLNLRDAYLPYKRLIAQVILDKNAPRIRTVVNKVSTIETQFRTFPLEVLGGDDDLNVTLRESGATFKFNFGDVYWNSRLQTEHARLIKLIADEWKKKSAEPIVAVWDVFAGVGPFAVPLAMKGCTVQANDLNPKSHEYLGGNIKGNKVTALCRPHNLDGRAFLRAMAAAQEPVHHIIMNLPASALDFLDEFHPSKGLLSYLLPHAPRPTVHCYCFSKADDPTADALQRASEKLGFELVKGQNVSLHRVRDVAPKKEMLCLSFPLPSAVPDEDTNSTSSGGGKRPLAAEEGAEGGGEKKRGRSGDGVGEG